MELGFAYTGGQNRTGAVAIGGQERLHVQQQHRPAGLRAGSPRRAAFGRPGGPAQVQQPAAIDRVPQQPHKATP